MIGTETAFILSGEELYLLSAITGGETLIGVQDPFIGWLTEEIVEKLESVRGDLHARGYVVVRDTGAAVEPSLAPLITALTVPHIAVMVTLHHPGHDLEERAYHVGHASTVKLSQSGQHYQLEPMTESAIAADICNWWGLHDQIAAPGVPFRLEQSTLLAARDAAGDAAAAAALLSEVGAPAETAASFASALHDPQTNGSLAAMRRGAAGWDVRGVAILESAATLWRLRAFQHHDAPWVEVAPESAAGLTQRVERLLQHTISAADNV
ncbi:MAG: hypothetical protein WCK70_05755 [Chloroflexales bacterium]